MITILIRPCVNPGMQYMSPPAGGSQRFERPLPASPIQRLDATVSESQSVNSAKLCAPWRRSGSASDTARRTSLRASDTARRTSPRASLTCMIATALSAVAFNAIAIYAGKPRGWPPPSEPAALSCAAPGTHGKQRRRRQSCVCFLRVCFVTYDRIQNKEWSIRDAARTGSSPRDENGKQRLLRVMIGDTWIKECRFLHSIIITPLD